MELAWDHERKWEEQLLPGWVWPAGAAICVIAGVAATLWGLVWFLALPAIAVAAVCLLSPTAGLYLLVLSMFYPYPFLPGMETYPINFVMLFVVLGFWMQRARLGRVGVERTAIDRAWAAFILALALSLVNASDLIWGLINLRHHILMVLLFYAVAGTTNIRHSKGLVALLVGSVCVLAPINIEQFVAAEGIKRVYGLARVHFSGLTTLAIVYLAARICFAASWKRAMIFGALLVLASFGQTANQSRGAIAMTILGLAVVLGSSWWWSRTHNHRLPRRRALQVAATGIVLATLVIVVAGPVLLPTYQRFIGYGTAATNLELRLFLWQTAWKAFTEQPLFGIGLGQTKGWENLFSDIQLDPQGRFTIGMSTHNAFLGYLAETGLVGISALLWVFWRMLSRSSRLLRENDLRAAGHLVGLWSVVVIIIVRSFFEHDVLYSIPGACTILFSAMAVSHAAGHKPAAWSDA